MQVQALVPAWAWSVSPWVLGRQLVPARVPVPVSAPERARAVVAPEVAWAVPVGQVHDRNNNNNTRGRHLVRTADPVTANGTGRVLVVVVVVAVVVVPVMGTMPGGKQTAVTF